LYPGTFWSHIIRSASLLYSDYISCSVTLVKNLAQLLDVLAVLYGEKTANLPTDPYLYLVWLHCGYPASDARCAKGWESLTSQIGVDAERILAAKPERLASALKPGGMVPELRAMRLKEIAERTVKQYGGDLRTGLNGLSIRQARDALKQFPNIADPGADRILLFAGIAPVAAVPSNCPHVLVRIQVGQERENYGRTYREAQQMMEHGLPPQFDCRIRAYLLLKNHGQQLCKSSNPKCDVCPVAPNCSFAGGELRGRPNPVQRKH
jgi:endonuclease-3